MDFSFTILALGEGEEREGEEEEGDKKIFKKIVNNPKIIIMTNTVPTQRALYQ